MGGADAVIARAREDFRGGDYRWVASVMKEVVFADPGNRDARELEADALEQLGYQAEAGTWRNEYLVGAAELRNGPPKLQAPSTLTADTLHALSLDNFFDLLGVRLNGPRAEGKALLINWSFADVGEKYALNLENAALTYTHGFAEAAQASLTLTRATLDAIVLKQTTFADAAKSGQIAVAGDPGKLTELLGLFDDFDPMFEIVAPKR
jgi:alkyl sulfatase BDS1-like metallo-beta-lactamase superfamily hydrolase